MKRELLAATAITSAVFGYSGVAHAQTFNWTGSYVGGFFGYGTRESHNITFRPIGAPGADLAFPGNIPTFNAGVPAGALSTGPFSALPVGSLGGRALLAGVTLGHNRQVDRFVFGIETDFASFMTASSFRAVQQNITANGVRMTTASASAGTDWLYTLRGRVGYAQDRLLLFATGGLALGRTHMAGSFGINENNLGFTPDDGGFFPGKGTSTSTSAFANAFGSRSRIRAGYTIGGGAEYAVTDELSIKLEGLYYDLGSTQALLNGSGGFGATSTATTIFFPPTTTTTAGALSVQPLRIRYRFDGALARLGVNYRFW